MHIKNKCIYVFKKQLSKLIRPTSKKVYNIHEPKVYSILTQLCVGLSKLNFHKFKHNFCDTLNPLCPKIVSIEVTERFLLLWHAYDEDKRHLLNRVDAILRPYRLTNVSNESLLEVTLFGHEKLSFDSNTKIPQATSKCIQASAWFQYVRKFAVSSPV